MDNKDFVSFETAKRLKEAGFDEPCHAFYWTCDGEFKDTKNRCHTNSASCEAMVTAPTLWQAQKWLREKKGIDIEIRVWIVGNEREYRPDIMPPKKNDYIAYPPEKTYEQALQEGLRAAVELIKPTNE